MTWPGGYACAPGLSATAGRHALRPLRWADREPIRGWRNAQLPILRQASALTAADQDTYFRDVIAPQMAMEQPPQVLLAMTEDDVLIGYGGVVHLNWPDRRGEVSFLTDTARLDGEQFAADWRTYLDLLLPLCRDALALHKLTTEAYDVRTDLFPILQERGFVQEGTLREHHLLDGRWVDSVVHGLVLSD